MTDSITGYSYVPTAEGIPPVATLTNLTIWTLAVAFLVHYTRVSSTTGSIVRIPPPVTVCYICVTTDTEGVIIYPCTSTVPAATRQLGHGQQGDGE